MKEKKTVSITVDPSIWDAAKAQGLNRSKVLEESLKAMIQCDGEVVKCLSTCVACKEQGTLSNMRFLLYWGTDEFCEELCITPDVTLPEDWEKDLHAYSLVLCPECYDKPHFYAHCWKEDSLLAQKPERNLNVVRFASGVMKELAQFISQSIMRIEEVTFDTLDGEVTKRYVAYAHGYVLPGVVWHSEEKMVRMIDHWVKANPETEARGLAGYCTGIEKAIKP